MVDFFLTEEQIALQKMARNFAQNEMAPVAAEYDESGEFPWPIFRQAHELGLMNTTIPEEYGGLGATAIEECILAEELFAGCAGMGSSMLQNNLANTPIILAGTHEQKSRFLEPLMDELTMTSFCLTEAGAGSDVANLRTGITKDGDDYILNGTKMFITNGGVAGQYTVFATFEPGKRNHRAFCAFVVPRDTPGVSVGKKENKMGHRASNTTEVIFENARVPKENLLGQEGEGFKIAMMTLAKARASIGACAVGIARAAFEVARDYAKERKTFGKPLTGHQAIQFMLADMTIKIETARLMCWKAAWLVEQGLPHRLESSIAKCYGTDMGMEVTTDAVQILGGYGYIREYPVEKYMRDAKLMQIYEGANQIQRMIIARDILQ